MYEVELKVRADHDAVRHRLEELGATPLGRVRQVDTYYDAPHRDFAETDEALRLREETVESGAGHDGTGKDRNGQTETRITYKGPLLERESKTREEAETAVADPDEMWEILDGLGFQPAATVEKERDRYRVEGYTVTLDTVDGLGEFVEVETEVGSEPEVEAARKEAAARLEQLGLDPDAGIRTSYLGLLLEAEEPAE
jgi:adenylate cyclase class 2